MGFSSIADTRIDQLVNEIEIARSERYAALNGGTPSSGQALAVGTNIQQYQFWTGQQTALQTFATNYVNHVTGPLNANQTAILKWTVATWRAAAELNVNGFRRVTEWDGVSTPSYSYGYAQAGDIIGPWLIEDLQNGYKALKWTNPSNSYISGSKRKSIGGSRAECITNWETADWGALVYAQHGVSAWSSVEYGYLAERHRTIRRVSFSNIERSLTIYMYASTGPYHGTIYDFDNMDGAEGLAGKHFLFDEVANFSDLLYDVPIGYFDTCPWSIFDGATGSIAEWYASLAFVAKWNFTYV
jgi:hypothetical protein